MEFDYFYGHHSAIVHGRFASVGLLHDVSLAGWFVKVCAVYGEVSMLILAHSNECHRGL